MGLYSETVGRMLSSAAGARSFEEPTGEGTAASFECGCFVNFRIRVDASSACIDSIAFRSNGCGYMVSGAASLAELFKHGNLREMHGLDADDLQRQVVSKVGDLPPERVQCAHVAIEALQSAFADHRRRQIEEFRGERELVCTCFGVSEDTIEEVIDRGAAVSVDDVTRICRAGGGCGSCRMIIADMIENSDRKK